MEKNQQEPKLKFILDQITDPVFKIFFTDNRKAIRLRLRRPFKVTFDKTRISGHFQVQVTLAFYDDANNEIITGQIMNVFSFKTLNNQKIDARPNIWEFVRAMQISTAHMRSLLYFETKKNNLDNLILGIESDQEIYDLIHTDLASQLN